MKILYITTYGKTMSFFDNLIKQLIDEGHTVDIATNYSIGKVPECYSEWRCKIYPISTSRSPFSIGNIKAIKQIRRIAKDYDIIHCHTPLAAMATRFACKPLRKKQGLKVIYTAHGFHFYKGAPLKNWLIYYPIEKLCSHWTDKLITINKEDYELAKKKMKAKQIEYVPGVGIDTKKFADVVVDRDKKREELGIPKDAFLLLSVGELNENKNHQVVIRAIAKLNNPDIHYMIAGQGDKKEKLESLAKELNVNLHLLGYRDDVAELYKIADVDVFPSIREGLGLAAVEGMASGLPLICADNRGTRSYAIDGVNALVCNSVDDYAKAIDKMQSSEYREQLGVNATQKAKGFDVSIINRKMMEIYQ